MSAIYAQTRLLAARRLISSLNSKALLSRKPATIAKGDVVKPDYRLTTLQSGFRVASENLEMPTATVNKLINNVQFITFLGRSLD